MQRGIATFTLDTGRCPPWLFERMVKLGREMTEVLVDEFGPEEFIARIADPVWFQSLGTVLAFDWNASGLTTILTAALKEAIRGQERRLGVFICGGKGATSRKTPDQITFWGERIGLADPMVKSLVYNSRMSAKVDSSLVQDGYQIYHHAFFFTLQKFKGKPKVAWTVVQQGMDTESVTARRYHWHDKLMSNVKGQKSKVSNNENIDFVDEPHMGIASQKKKDVTLNLTAGSSSKNRQISAELASSGWERLKSDFEILAKHSSELSRMVSLKKNGEKTVLLELAGVEFKHHPVEFEDFTKSKYLQKILNKLGESEPKTYEEFVATEGVGPKTVRALSLVSEVIYGAEPSYQDPARYSFAHGGKDGTPYPVDRKTYDQTIETLGKAVRKSRISPVEKDKALRRLNI